MQYETISGKVTFEEILFRTIGNISFLSTQIYSSSENEWQKNVLNYEQAINELESMASPFLSADYWDQKFMIQAIAQIFLKQQMEKKKLLAHTKAGYDLEVRTTARTANARFSLIMRALDDKNILFSRSATLVDDEESDDEVDREEPEGIIEESEEEGYDGENAEDNEENEEDLFSILDLDEAEPIEGIMEGGERDLDEDE